MKVSILLPVYDAAATLTSCLKSIARQTERDFECIIVDDGSNDDSAATAERWCRSDARFSLLKRPHLGLVAALEAGLRRCRAPLVARMDADDLMHRERLALQVAALADESLAAVGAHVRLFPRPVSEGLSSYERWLNSITNPDDVARDAFIECPIAHPTLVIRRALLDALGYRDCGWPEDWDLVQRLLEAHRVGVVPKRLVSWRNGPTRMSRTHPSFTTEAFTECRAHYLATRFLATADGYVLWGFGGTGKALRRALAPHGKAPRAIVELHPGRLGQRIHDAPVIAPEGLIGCRDKIIVSVAGAGPRSEIRAALGGWGFLEGRDFVCAA